MAGINKVIIVGNLGKDPELRFTQGNTAVCNFSVATAESWKDKDTGEKKEKTEWHRIVVWGKLAEVCGQYLHKGKQVYIEGKLQTREWEDQQGQKRYTTEVVAHTMQMLGTRADNAGGQQQRGPAPAAQDGAGGAYQDDPFGSPPAPGPDEDDLPF